MPTLLLAECVFIYIDTIHSNSILHWFADVFRQAGCMSILYDPVGLDDPFGKVMISNLKVGGQTDSRWDRLTDRGQRTEDDFRCPSSLGVSRSTACP